MIFLHTKPHVLPTNWRSQEHQSMVFPPFDDHNDPRLKCCCDCMNIRTGVIIIGALELTSLLINAVSVLAEGKDVAIGLTSTAIGIVVVSLLFYALRFEKANFLLPHLVCQLLAVVGLVIGSIASIAAAAAVGVTVVGEGGNRRGGEQAIVAAEGGVAVGMLVFLALLMLVAAGLEVWFFVVVLRLYRHYRDKSTSGAGAAAPTVRYGGGSGGGGGGADAQQQPMVGTGSSVDHPPTYQEYSKEP